MTKIQRSSGQIGKLKGVKLPDRHPLLGGPLRAQDETVTFIFVNLLDYFMTYVILYYSHARPGLMKLTLAEGNPVAAYFINHWGPVKGMLGFKLAMVLFVCLVTQTIAYRSEETARRVLNLGSLLTGCVVAYSLWLLLQSLV